LIEPPAAAPNAAPSFVRDTSTKAQVSERTVREDVQIATKLAPDVKETIRDTPLADNKTALMRLAKKTAEAQRAIVAAADLSHPKAVEQAEHEVRAREKHEKAALQIAEAPAVDVRIEVADATSLPLEDGLVDLCVTSPPYGLDKPYRSTTDPAEGWQNFMDDWLAEAHRVSKNGGRLALNVPLDTTVGGFRPTYAQAVDCARRAGCAQAISHAWARRHHPDPFGLGGIGAGTRGDGGSDGSEGGSDACAVRFAAVACTDTRRASSSAVRRPMVSACSTILTRVVASSDTSGASRAVE